MESRYFTKKALIATNEAARKAGGTYIDPGYVQSLPDTFKYPVCMALTLPQGRGWYRYVVTVGRNLSDDVRHLMLDMPCEEFERLPKLEVEGVDGPGVWNVSHVE